jgi:flagellar basal body-associated protein FliL
MSRTRDRRHRQQRRRRIVAVVILVALVGAAVSGAIAGFVAVVRSDTAPPSVQVVQAVAPVSIRFPGLDHAR